MAKANTQHFKERAERLQKFLVTKHPGVSRSDALNALAYADYNRPFNKIPKDGTGTDKGASRTAKSRVSHSCKQCGTSLAGEYCRDLTCVFSDWPQSVDREFLYDHSTAEVEAAFGVRKRTAPAAAPIMVIRNGGGSVSVNVSRYLKGVFANDRDMWAEAELVFEALFPKAFGRHPSLLLQRVFDDEPPFANASIFDCTAEFAGESRGALLGHMKAFTPCTLYAEAVHHECHGTNPATGLVPLFLTQDIHLHNRWVWVGAGGERSAGSFRSAEEALADLTEEVESAIAPSSHVGYDLAGAVQHVRLGGGVISTTDLYGQPAPPVPGRYDLLGGQPLIFTNKRRAMSRDELQRVTKGGEFRVDFVVPFDITQLISLDADSIDAEIEKLTIQDGILEDMSFERFHHDQADFIAAREYVFIRVIARWDHASEE